jgi:hypothetical protein
MKKKQPIIQLLVLIVPVFIQFASFAQGVIKTESGARIISETGSYWVVDNGSFILISQSAANPATMGNLKIEDDASLTIEPLSYLTVSGTLTNAFGNDGLIVKSGGSLIQNTAGVPATVERAITAGEWHLISAPVSNAVSSMFTGYYLQKHTESTNVYNDIIPANVPLTPMQGFALFGDAGLPTAIYSGTLDNGVESISTTYSGAGKGWNLVGNPYSSSIDWNAASGWMKTNVNGSVYFHVNNATWATWNGAIGTNGGSRYIASGQGFFVEATANGVLGMNNSVKVHNAATFFKNSGEAVNNMIRLEVSGNGYADEAVVWFRPEATAAFDGEYDAHKLYGDVAGAAQIYSLGVFPLAINVLPETPAVPVGIHAGTGGTYTIAATEINDFTDVSLEDTKTGIFTNMMNDSYTFNFVPGENELRFVLHFGPLPVKEKENPVTNIYSYQKTVYIDLKEQTKGEAYIYTVSGQLIATASATKGINKIILTTTGVYVVKLVTDKTMVVKKVWIE